MRMPCQAVARSGGFVPAAVQRGQRTVQHTHFVDFQALQHPFGTDEVAASGVGRVGRSRQQQRGPQKTQPP